MILALPLIPLMAALLMLFIPSDNEKAQRNLVVLATGLCLALTLIFFCKYDTSLGDFQFVQSYEWIMSLGIKYQAGFDGINLVLCLLHALVSFAAAFVSCWPKERQKEYLFYFLILTSAMYGVFTCLDIFFLYVFYEMTLIPLYPMIGIWGAENRKKNALVFTIYLTAGAVIALFGILLLYREAGFQSFDLIELQQMLKSTPLKESSQHFLAPLLLIGLGTLTSLWPLHSWSPAGYSVAPTSVNMLHAGVKPGPYLMLRLVVGLLPTGLLMWASPLALLAVIGILYAGYTAMKQTDMKLMTAFSGISHMGYIFLGIAAMTGVSISGAVLLIFAHGLSTAAAFAILGFLYEQTGKSGVNDFGGLGKTAPFIAIAFIMAAMASLGLPGFANFPAELLVFIGAWEKFPAGVAIGVFGILITALYLLRAIQNVCYGPATSQLKDARGFLQKFPIIFLLGALLLFGFWPNSVLRLIQPSVQGLLP